MAYHSRVGREREPLTHSQQEPAEHTSRSMASEVSGYQESANNSAQVTQLKERNEGIKESTAPKAKGEGKANDPKPAKLHLHADLDNPKMPLIKQLFTGEVGHSWVSLEWKDTNAIPEDIPENHSQYLKRGGQMADPFGFWPKMFDAYDDATQEWSSLPPGQRVGYSKNPFKSYVPGQMVHPDNLHTAVATQSYDVTEDEAKNVINYAESKRGADYSVYFYNCTTFAKEAAEVAGKKPPKVGHLGVAYPKKMYESIKKAAQKGKDGAALNLENLQERFITAQFRELVQDLVREGVDVNNLTEEQWVNLMTERGFEEQVQEDLVEEMESKSERRERRREERKERRRERRTRRRAGRKR